MKKTILFTLTLIFLATSCNNNLTEPFLADTTEAVSKFSFTATISEGLQVKTTDDDGLQTRSTVEYGNTDYTAGEKSEWLAGDMIRVVFYNPANGAEQYSARFVTATSGSSAEFVYDSGTVPTGTAAFDIKAFYPADISDSATPVSISPFALGDGTSADNISPFDMMTASKTGVTVLTNGEAALSFTHELAMLRFSIKNNASQDVYIDQIRVHTNDYKDDFFEKVIWVAPANGLFSSPFTFEKSSRTFELVGDANNGKIAANGGVTDFYMTALENEVKSLTNNFVIMVVYKKGSASSADAHVQQINISKPVGSFLRTSFTAGNRYLFKLLIPENENVDLVTYDGIGYYRNTVNGEVWATEIPEISGRENIAISESGAGGATWNVTRIFNAKKRGNSTVKNIHVPPSVICISDEAFRGYTALENIYLYSSTPPRLGRNLFKDCYTASSGRDEIEIHIVLDNTIVAAYNAVLKYGDEGELWGWKAEYTSFYQIPGNAGGSTRLRDFCGYEGTGIRIRSDINPSSIADYGSGGIFDGW